MLISRASHHLKSILTTLATDNAMVECADEASRDTVTIRIEGLFVILVNVENEMPFNTSTFYCVGVFCSLLVIMKVLNYYYRFCTLSWSSKPQKQNTGVLHKLYCTAEVTWKQPSNDSRVDFYQYQLIDNLTEVIVSNTTNTIAVLSGIPYNVNMSFVISAHNCVGASQQVVLSINIGICLLNYNNE